jgi:UDP-N-acetylmuramate--alanine ligase
MIADQIEGALYCPTLQDVTRQIKAMAQPGDLILTVGAGDIYKAGDAVIIKD